MSKTVDDEKKWNPEKYSKMEAMLMEGKSLESISKELGVTNKSLLSAIGRFLERKNRKDMLSCDGLMEKYKIPKEIAEKYAYHQCGKINIELPKNIVGVFKYDNVHVTLTNDTIIIRSV